MAALFWLSDEAWAAIEPHLPHGRPGKPRVDDRRVISGILHVLKTGCRWRDVPPDYGPPTTVYNRYHRWARRGIWQRVFARMGRCRRNSRSIAATSKHIARRKAQKGGVDASDWHLAWRKNEQDTCFGR